MKNDYLIQCLSPSVTLVKTFWKSKYTLSSGSFFALFYWHVKKILRDQQNTIFFCRSHVKHSVIIVLHLSVPVFSRKAGLKCFEPIQQDGFMWARSRSVNSKYPFFYLHPCTENTVFKALSGPTGLMSEETRLIEQPEPKQALWV